MVVIFQVLVIPKTTPILNSRPKGATGMIKGTQKSPLFQKSSKNRKIEKNPFFEHGRTPIFRYTPPLKPPSKTQAIQSELQYNILVGSSL